MGVGAAHAGAAYPARRGVSRDPILWFRADVKGCVRELKLGIGTSKWRSLGSLVMQCENGLDKSGNASSIEMADVGLDRAELAKPFNRAPRS
jgi:hypothetical protein